jgi:Ca-activated chloride channel family protein
VLIDVEAAISGVQVEDIYPYPLPDLFAGNQLIVAGRYRGGGPADLTLRGEVDGEPRTYGYRDLTFAERGGQEFIARLWAQRKIGYLLSQIRLHGVKDELVKEIVTLSSRYGIVTPYTSFLVQEPGMALSQEGRDQLGRGLQGKPMSGVGGAAAPAAMESLVGGDRSGQAAVAKAVTEQALTASEQAAAPSAAEVTQALQQVGDRTFLFSNGAWVDTTFDSTKTAAESVAFGSKRYFALLAAHPEIGRYLALGDRVTVMLDGKAYAVAPGAVEMSAGPTPVSPLPSPAAGLGTSAVTPAETPAETTVPVSPTVILCPGAAALGLMGVMVPAFLRRRQ